MPMKFVISFFLLLCVIRPASAGTFYFFHWGSSESTNEMLERSPDGHPTPELFDLIDRWYFNTSMTDRAGPGFYMASEPLSTMGYGEKLTVVRIETEAGHPAAGENAEKAEAIKVRTEKAAEAGRREEIPLIARYANHDDLDWFVLSRVPKAGDRVQITLIPFDEHSSAELKQEVRAHCSDQFESLSLEKKLRMLGDLRWRFSHSPDDLPGKAQLKKWLGRDYLPMLKPTVVAGLKQLAKNKGLDGSIELACELQNAILTLDAVGGSEAQAIFREYMRQLLPKVLEAKTRPARLNTYSLSIFFSDMAKRAEGRWPADPELRELMAQYLSVPERAREEDKEGLVTKPEIDLALRAYFGIPSDPEFAKSFEFRADPERPIKSIPLKDEYDLKELFGGDERYRGLLRNRAENLWPALGARIQKIGLFYMMEVGDIVRSVLRDHLNQLASKEDAEDFLRKSEADLIKNLRGNFRFTALAAMASTLIEGECAFSDQLRASVRRAGLEILEKANAKTLARIIDGFHMDLLQPSLFDLFWELFPEYRGKLFAYHFDHFTKHFYASKKAEINQSLFEAPKKAHQNLTEVLSAGLIAGLFEGADRLPWLKKAALPIEGSIEYSEIARIFTLVDPAFVSEDLRLMEAAAPHYRFNEEYHYPDGVGRQTAWENLSLGWFFLARRLNGADFSAFEDTVRLLVNGGVEGGLRTELYERFSSKSYRGERWTEINPKLLLSKKRKTELGRFFNIREERGKAELLFKTSEEILDAFPGIAKQLSRSPENDWYFTGDARFPQAVVRWIMQSVENVRDPVRKAARVLHLLPKLHPYRNANGRLARMWASLILVRAGHAIPVGLPTYDFGLTEEDLRIEVEKAIRLGELWKKDLEAAHAAGIPAKDYFQNRFKNSPLEGAIHWQASSPKNLKRELREHSPGELPGWSAELASYLDTAFYFEHQKNNRIAYRNEEQRRKMFVELRDTAISACQRALSTR